jgi:predicted DNA-binding transcriptional regulator YafY
VRGPWLAAGDERATIALSPQVAWWASSSLAGAATARTRADGWVEITIPVTDEREVAPWILEFGPDAVVLEPVSLRSEIVARLEAILD